MSAILTSGFTAPVPPPGMRMDPFWQPFMTFVQVIPVLAVLWFGLRIWLPKDRTLLAVCLAGGALASLIEPLTDHVAFVWFAPDGLWEMFATFNRPMPWFILPCYIWFVGGQLAYLLHRVRTGVTARQLWVLYAVFVGTNVVMEVPAIAAGIYAYYGAQPFKIAGLPIWFQSISAAAPLFATAVFVHVWPRLHGWRRLAAVPIAPAVWAMTNAGAGWPAWSALNSTDNILITSVCGLITIGLSLGIAATSISMITSAAGSRAATGPDARELAST
jgi:hypothetical protein